MSGDAALPAFRYHPDPVGTGSVAASDVECVVCRKRRGFIYVGPVDADDEWDDCICPWCIADGSAHEKLGAEFTDPESVGAGGRPLPAAVVEAVAFRTPGFLGWQQERWLACCGDAAAFVGRAGRAEIERRWPDAAQSIRADASISNDDDWEDFLAGLEKDGSPSAYVFRCLRCRKHLGYADFD